MLNYKDIRSLHLEISTRCNAACPDCPRNFRGVNIVDNYPLTDLKLDQAQKLFPPAFLQQLDHILINGNYGDFVTARDGIDIVEYFLKSNQKLTLEISTNASAKPEIWSHLGRLGAVVLFRLDGLRDTHYLYRQNTDWDLIISNAKSYIDAGGNAVWAMIPFDHNRHQIKACQDLAKELGFTDFQLIDAGRDTMPVFDKNKKLTHIIGNYQGSTNFDELYIKTSKNTSISIIKQIKNNDKTIDCYSKKNQEIYVNAIGEVYPCCWLGYYPNYQPNNVKNIQLLPMISKNNALEYGLESAIEWFNQIERSWQCSSVAEGRLYTCEQTCAKL